MITTLEQRRNVINNMTSLKYEVITPKEAVIKSLQERLKTDVNSWKIQWLLLNAFHTVLKNLALNQK